MSKVFLCITFVFIGYIFACMFQPLINKQDKVTYTQEQVDKLVDIVLDELDRCGQDLYDIEEELVECNVLTIKCVLTLIKTKTSRLKGVF